MGFYLPSFDINDLENRLGKIEFKKAVYFSGATFQQANFRKAKFQQQVNFSGAEFQLADFIGAEFFDKLRFSGESIFPSVREDEVRENEENEVKTYKEGIYINLSRVRFHKPEEVIFDYCDLSLVSFLYTDITKVIFRNVRWVKIDDWNNKSSFLNKIRSIKIDGYRLYDEIKETNGAKSDNKNPKDSNANRKDGNIEAVLSVYRNLKDNYEHNANYKEAGRFFIGEMELRRRITKSRIEKFILRFYRLSDYGENVTKPALILVSIPVIVTIFQFLLDPSQIGENYLDIVNYILGKFYNMIQVSIDSNLSGIDRMISIIQKIATLPFLVMFGLALRRNFARRVRH